MAEITVDARGHRCPVPTLRLRRAMHEAAPGDVLVLHASDPMARIDVPHFLSDLPADLASVETAENGDLSFRITLTGRLR